MDEEDEKTPKVVNPEDIYENLKASKFKQQKLPAWRPFPSIVSISIIFSSFGIFSIVIGAVLLHYSKKPIELKEKYYEIREGEIWTNTEPLFEVEEKIENPVIYYEINNYFQNHRNYMKSRSQEQLEGNTKYYDNAPSDCDPIKTMGDISDDIDDEKKKKVAVPCGLAALNFFQDEFTLQGPIEDKGGPVITINRENIAWKKDKEQFKIPKGREEEKWIDYTQEPFIVWMRPSPLQNFRKIYGRVDEDLQPGKYYVQIENNFNPSRNIKKLVVIMGNLTKLGGNNKFMGIAYVVFGVLCLCITVVFIILTIFFQKRKSVVTVENSHKMKSVSK